MADNKKKLKPEIKKFLGEFGKRALFSTIRNKFSFGKSKKAADKGKDKLETFSEAKLDENEQIKKDFKAGNYERITDKNYLKMLERSAMNKTDRICFRISRPDLLKIKTIAQRAGLPYQKLIKSILHDFAENEY